MKRKLSAAVLAAGALGLTAAPSAHAGVTSWSWRASGATVAYVTINTNNNTLIREIVGDCGFGEADDVIYNVWVNGSATFRLECRFDLNDVWLKL